VSSDENPKAFTAGPARFFGIVLKADGFFGSALTLNFDGRKDFTRLSLAWRAMEKGGASAILLAGSSGEGSTLEAVSGLAGGRGVEQRVALPETGSSTSSFITSFAATRYTEVAKREE
jgi:hypothetical protein